MRGFYADEYRYCNEKSKAEQLCITNYCQILLLQLAIALLESG